MAEAAKSARSAFQDIGSSAQSGSAEVTGGTTNVRAALGLLDNTIRGNHAAAMADLVREFQHTQAVMALLPFAAVIGGIAAVAGIAVEAAEKYRAWREESQKLADDQMKFGTAVNASFGQLDEKILEAEKRADELRNDHLGALRKELELIDKQSMDELVKQLEAIAKASDGVFADLQGHWYTFGSGSAGAKHALDEFQAQYESLMRQGKQGEASDLLKGTRESAERVLALQKQARDSGSYASAMSGGPSMDSQQQAAHEAAIAALQKANIDYGKDNIAAQEELLRVLNDQVTAEGKVAELKKLQSGNATTQTGNEGAARASEAARTAAAVQGQIAESQLQAAKSFETARLEIARAGIAERLAVAISFAEQERDVQLQTNAAETAALNRAAGDYANQVKAMHGKAEEIEADSAAKIQELRSAAAVAQAQKDAQEFETGERNKIQITQQGSAARLAAITQVLKETQALGLQDTEFYKQLGTQRVEETRKEAEEEAKLRAEAGKEEAENQQKLAEISLAAIREAQTVSDSARRLSQQQQIAEAVKAADDELQVKLNALHREAAALNADEAAYENKLKANQDKETQLIREHENQVTQIKDQATIQRNQKIQAAEQQFQNEMAAGLTQAIMGQKSFASAMTAVANEVTSSLLQMAIKHIEANMMTKQSDAAKAARAMFNAGMDLPAPVNIIMAPLLAAGAYAKVMAFAGGTDYVPGTGKGDITPAMLTPGEGVVPGGVMDGLRSVAKNGGFQQKQASMIHAPFSPNVQALDAKGVDKVLTKQHKVFQRHLDNAIRKMNK